MEIKKTSDKYNQLLGRREITFFIEHYSEGTPKLYDVRKALAQVYGKDEDSVYVIKLKTSTGTNKTIGEAEIYDKSERAQSVIPKHIQLRNSPDRGKISK